jgi:hypothetical protein
MWIIGLITAGDPLGVAAFDVADASALSVGVADWVTAGASDVAGDVTAEAAKDWSVAGA